MIALAVSASMLVIVVAAKTIGSMLPMAAKKLGIDPALMTEDEIQWLDDYHRDVYDKIAPRLKDEAVKAWLKDVTRPLRG